MSRLSLIIVGVAFAFCGAINLIREVAEFHHVGAFFLMLGMCVMGVLLVKFGYEQPEDDDED